MRLAMWSGPRNLSTAMMYSFAARPDFAVMDEPFYGPFLELTGIDHPMRDEVLAAVETDTARISEACSTIPDGVEHLYMKHMPHHMVPGVPYDWAEGAVHVHLIRHPARVIASYLAKREEMNLDDIGYRQQAEVFDQFPGPVLDSADVRKNPEAALGRLCAEIGLPFDARMLSWASGGIPEDGPWAPHWYNAVHKSTGFAGEEGPLPDISGPLLAEALPVYDMMRQAAI